jgi:multiple sugar transport system permease protein
MANSSPIRRSRKATSGKAFLLLLVPFLVLFTIFIVVPITIAIVLSFTSFDTVQAPKWNNLGNYVYLLTQDTEFMKFILPNSIQFALIVGPIGYVLQFLLAWALVQIPRIPRTILALIFYSPSMTGGVVTAVIWRVIFTGDQYGYLNYSLKALGIIEQPVQWLVNSEIIMPVMIIVSLWSSMGIGFLAMLSGALSIDPELYEAGYIDGLRNRFQEIIYITIPSMKPQMLFGAVMAIVYSFSTGSVGVDLTGANPTPGYAGSTMVTHIDDFGFLQYDMGYANAIAVVLLLMIFAMSQVANKLFMEKSGGEKK